MYVDDETRMQHMLDAAHDAAALVKNRSRADLDPDLALPGALIWCITVIGEAASHLTPDGRDALPSVPWTQIVGMRNRLVHGYYLIDRDIAWETVTVRLP